MGRARRERDERARTPRGSARSAVEANAMGSFPEDGTAICGIVWAEYRSKGVGDAMPTRSAATRFRGAVGGTWEGHMPTPAQEVSEAAWRPQGGRGHGTRW